MMKEEDISDKRPFSEMPLNIDGRNSKELTPGISGDAIPTSSTGPTHHPGANSNIDDINGHPMFPSGKFFGLFPRMANVDDQVS